ncbi:choice-of-anchor tandem repeat GloVer-containing protein [Ideonella sp.]|uniref:choice-of-anchor tandem repeat GloVer-containing protein n=1 Tax=Ideonella sp. TaxID=1929293 RepID=UPI0035B40FC1
MQFTLVGLRAVRQFLNALCGAGLAASLVILPSAHAGTKEPLETLHVFAPLDGDAPGPLTLASDGRFYGVATYGGALRSGTVFSMDKRGTFEVLHSFDASVDGQYPSTTLLSASDGYLYGTVRYGGVSHCGSLFRVSPSTGEYTVMRPFAVLGRRTEGCNPRGAMAQGPDGWIYGTTEYGGSADAGTVYKWHPASGKFKTLRNFAGWGTGDGYSPVSVALSPTGELVGVTPSGGKFDVGTIYSLKPDGSEYRVVYSFTYESDTIGSNPFGQLLLAKDGNFYGSTGRGGYCCGTIFRLSQDGTVSLVHTLEFFGDLGFPVNGDLILGPEGLLYGVTRGSGAEGGGTVFTMSTAGEARVLQAFTYAGTPNSPMGRLTRAGSYMYGVASRGFSEGSVIYRVLKK